MCLGNGYEILDKVDKLIIEKKKETEMHRDDLITKLKEKGFDYFKSCCSEGYYNEHSGVAITMLDSKYKFIYTNNRYNYVDIMNGYEILEKVDESIEENRGIEMNKAKIPLKSLLGIIDKTQKSLEEGRSESVGYSSLELYKRAIINEINEYIRDNS